MNDKVNSSKHHIRNDIIFIIVILLVAIIGMIYLFNFRATGDMVKVTVDGKPFGEYSLSQDIVKEIYVGDSAQHNRLVIKDGKAYVEYATCPDGICVDHRPIFRDGESIVCLPNKVVVTVTTQSNKNDPDIII